MTYTNLLIEAEDNYGLKIKEKPLDYNLKGIYNNNRIIIDKKIINDSERKCILAEEIGHHCTTCGNIIDETQIVNKKKEIIARRWAYTKLIGILNILDAYKCGVRNRYELADYLNVTEDFLEESLNYYQVKYNNWYEIDNYIIRFNPLGVIEKFQDF